MTSLTSFELFPKLPPEIRHKIYRDAFPARVLQLGVDFPYPKLLHPDVKRPDDDLYRNICPTPASFPALFHTCRESRALCLEDYIPFAYSYMHPSIDTLYVSRVVVRDLFESPGATRIHAPLYPLALLDRVAMQFDTIDTKTSGTGLSSADKGLALNAALELMGSYGVPKELLLVRDRSSDSYKTEPSEPWFADRILGIRSLNARELKDRRSRDADVKQMMEILEEKLARYQFSVGWWTPWWNMRTPKVLRVAGVWDRKNRKNSDVLPSPKWSKWRLLTLGKRVAREWFDDITEQAGVGPSEMRTLYANGNPAYPENLNKALTRLGRNKWMLDLAPLRGVVSTLPTMPYADVSDLDM